MFLSVCDSSQFILLTKKKNEIQNQMSCLLGNFKGLSIKSIFARSTDFLCKNVVFNVMYQFN